MRYETHFQEQFFGRQKEPALPMHVLTIADAEKGQSFENVFRAALDRWMRILPHMPGITELNVREKAVQKAWRNTYRAMRGHTDMSNTARYAMSKDASYLRGLLLDEKLLQENKGYRNEAAITSVKGMELLSYFDIKESDLPYPYENVTEQYMRLLLAEENLKQKPA